MTRNATIFRKAIASSVNVALVFVITGPIYWLWGLEWWRVSCVSLFFVYNLLLPQRCLGMIVAHTRQNLPTSPAYAALYTASFGTLLWWMWLPLDLALVNGLFIQLPCLLVYGNTAHGLATGRRTMTEAEHLFECVVMKGQCPDCNAVRWVSNSDYVKCQECNSTFIVGSFYVRRCK
jgi:hypothetical protein